MIDRREFIRGTAGSAMIFPATLAGLARERNGDLLEKRALGKTGEMLSIIGFGGIVVMDASTREASLRVGEAIDKGVNYFDVAPTYGNAEDMLGPALAPYRKDVFLACKTTQRTAPEAEKELHSSLEKMRTDHFDLYQLHAVTKLADVETILGSGGALEAFLKAREAGKVRFIGFSAHSVEAALALIQRFDFDTILFPVNFRTWYAGRFGPRVLDEAQKKQMGILALKAMANSRLEHGAERVRPKCWYRPLLEREEAALGLNFTLSHPVTAAIPPGDEELFRLALDLASQFAPLSGLESTRLRRMAQEGEPIFRFPSDQA